MTVSLADDVSLTSTAPEPAQEAQASIAETLTEKPTPAPVVKAPVVKKPEPAPTPPPMQRTTSREKPKPQPQQTNDKSGGSLIGKNFLQGLGSSTASEAKAPAAQMGPAEQASLQQAIARQLRPYWKPPSGADADQLVTILAFDLNPDGSLAGKPRVVAQSGIDASNKAQAGRHVELAVRAVELAAPFDLPPEYYSAWKRIKAWRFDWKSAQ
jgi:outer membrane biosynthesis protein TonB